MSDPLEAFLGEQVVIDTDGPIVYLGVLKFVGESALVLHDADLHDCRDGHATKEVYILEARQQGIAVNRRQVVVLRRPIMSVSRLRDIVIDPIPDD